MKDESSSPIERVRLALLAAGVDSKIEELAASTRTAAEAAAAVGCTVAQIAKSLVFRSASGASILVIASGANRVDEARLEELIGENVSRATPDFVRAVSGYAIGGVPPVAHRQAPGAVFIDTDLLQYEYVWAAAGTPHAVVRLSPSELLRVSGGSADNIAQR